MRFRTAAFILTLALGILVAPLAVDAQLCRPPRATGVKGVTPEEAHYDLTLA